MVAPALVVWKNRILVDEAERQPVLLPLETRDRASEFVDLDPALDGKAQLGVEPAQLAGLRFIDPMFELGRFAGSTRLAVVRALALSRWSADTCFCSNCGAPLRWETPGRVKLCQNPSDPHRHFPRIDPATIMLVHDGERMLLGRQPGWPDGMYSTLAGFIDPGESAEAAVAREVLEEAGVSVAEVSYFGSESWPFPRSLMLGFFARATSTEIVRGHELEDVRWFDVEEGLRLERSLAERVPHADTIARRLIGHWLRERTTPALY